MLYVDIIIIIMIVVIIMSYNIIIIARDPCLVDHVQVEYRFTLVAPLQ